MADLKRIQHTISKGMKLYCTVEDALEDVIVVSLKHKTKEFRGILLDSSERRLPPGLCFKDDSSTTKGEGEKEGNSNADGPDQAQTTDVKGVTLDCRYSYNNDPAKYNEQPLALTSFISIRPARGKQVRNIRLRPRQTLCSKCKAAIHDSKSKSPNKGQKSEGDGQEIHPHNTRYRAAQAAKPSDPANQTAEGPTLRSGVRNRRSDSAQANPKVLLENIRPKRDVKPTAKKKEADAALKSKQDNSKKSASVGETSDSSVNSSSGKRKDDDNARVILERSVSVDNPSALSQYNKQPVVRLDKSAVNSASVRTESREDKSKEEKQEKAPLLFVNMRTTPKITISFGGAGDRDVLKIQPRLPGEEIKSPDGHSTADESPAPGSPLPPQFFPQRKAKKASKRTRDKQRYRIVNDGEASSEVTATGIKIAHKRHKRKHRHRHASSEEENFNSDVGQGKLPSLVTKLTVVTSSDVNDLNGNEKRDSDKSDVLKDSSNETPTHQEESSEVPVSTSQSQDMSDIVNQEKRDEASSDFVFQDDDPLNLKGLSNSPVVDHSLDRHTSRRSTPVFRPPSSQSMRSVIDRDTEASVDHPRSEASDVSAARSDLKPFEMWGSPEEKVGSPERLGSPDKLEPPDFYDDGSPARIEAPPFQSDDSQDGLIVGPVTVINRFGVGKSPVKDEKPDSFDSLSPLQSHNTDEKRDSSEGEEDDEKKEAVPYGTGVFEDLTPDEDEGDHDDQDVGQPVYQASLTKKPRMMGGWQAEGLSSSYLQRKAAGYGSSMFSRRMFTNGPSSYYSQSPSGSSLYASHPSGYSHTQTIQNSPTPIIQKSPVPIFNYHSSRYQGSPNRRFGSSPSRRYDHVPDSSSSRHHSVLEGGMRQSSQSSLSRYTRHDSEQFSGQRESQPGASNEFRSPAESSDLPHSVTNRYPPTYESRASNIRYQPSAEKSTDSRYGAPHKLVPAGRHAEESSGTKTFRAPESGSALRYVSSISDTSSVPRFAVPLDNNVSTTQYPAQGSSAALPLFSAHPPEGSLTKQYPPLGSTEARFQAHSDSRYTLPGSASIPSSPSPLSIQTDSRSTSNLGPVPIYHSESERKSSAPRYETVDTSALFMTHSHAHKSVPVSESAVQNFLSKPSSASSSASHSPIIRVPSTDSLKAGNLFSAPPSGLSFLHQEPQISSGSSAGIPSNVGILYHSQGQSSISRRSSSLSQSVVNVSDSDDDMDLNMDPSAVPGFNPGSGGSDLNRMPMMKIQAVNLSNIITEDGRDIHVGDVQWGKVQGFPWWPCRVSSIRTTHRDHREQDLIVTHVCHVSWFGSSTVSDLSPMDLRPFREEFPKRLVKKKRGNYQIAIQQAMHATGMTQMTVAESSRGLPLQLSLHDLVS